MNIQEKKKVRRIRRKEHIRKTVFGTEERLRMSVFKSCEHIYVQLINDVEGKTICQASTIDKEVRAMLKPDMTKIDQGKVVGQVIAKRATALNIKKAAFDRNGYIYHGRVKALAEAARQNGLEL